MYAMVILVVSHIAVHGWIIAEQLQAVTPDIGLIAICAMSIGWCLCAVVAVITRN